MKNKIMHCALAMLTGCLAATAVHATVVSFSFSGSVVYIVDPSNSIPAGIALGTPFTGSVSYDTGAVASTNSSPTQANYAFGTNGGFTISATIGGHTFYNIKHTQPQPYAYVTLDDNFSGFDALIGSDDLTNLRMDGGPLPGNPLTGNIYLELKDTNNATYNSTALPITQPVLANYSYSHRIQLAGYNNSHTVFALNADITSFSISSQPQLTIKVLPNKNLTLSWPLNYQGFTLLQYTNAPAGAGWTTNAAPVVDTATDHTVMLPAGKSACLFRLKSP